MSVLQTVIDTVKNHPGLENKKALAQLGPLLAHFPGGNLAVGPGDDAGALQSEGGFLLTAHNGLDAPSIEENARRAGRMLVDLNVMNLAAMGGAPLAMTSAIHCADPILTTEFTVGLTDGCRGYNIPLMGGHYDAQSATPAFSVSAIGRADKLIPGNAMRPGDAILAVVDLRGRRVGGTLHFFDSSAGRSADSLWRDIGVLAYLADEQRIRSCRNLGTAGIVGTLALMAEASGCGCRIDLEAIPRPDRISQSNWAVTMPGFGFAIAAHSLDAEKIIDSFTDRGIACVKIGEATIGGLVELHLEGESRRLFDFRQDTLIGWRK